MIKKHIGRDLTMARILVTVTDEKTIADAIAKYGKRDVCLALDENVGNRRLAQALGLDRYALVGAKPDHDAFSEVIGKSAPKKKASLPKKKEALVKEEAVVDDETKEVQ
jgi:hypothetical protein